MAQVPKHREMLRAGIARVVHGRPMKGVVPEVLEQG